MAFGERTDLYYRFEDHPTIAAASNANRYSIRFSNLVDSVKFEDHEDLTKKVRAVFNPTSKTSVKR